MTKHVVVRAHLMNVGDGPDFAKIQDLRRFVKSGATLILGQEFGDRERLVNMFLTEFPTWRVLWEPDTNPGRKTPILYDNKVLKLHWWDALVTLVPGTWLGRAGAGPSRTEEKRLNRARFEVRANGVRFKVLNHHGVASAYSTRGAEAENRKAALRVQVAAFFRVAERGKIPVIGGGDWNMQRDNPDLVAMVPGNWSWDSVGPTHGKRTIDILGHRVHPRIKAVNAGVEDTDGSINRDDHRSPWVDYALR